LRLVKYIVIEREGENMKYLLFILLLGAIIIAAGCTTASNYTSVKQTSAQSPPITAIPQTPIRTTMTISPVITTVQTENLDSIQEQLNSKWRQIRDVYDTFNENKNKLDLTSNNDDINQLREKNIPYTISEYQRIKDDLSQININNYDLKNERNIQILICDYKIKFLQALSSSYHAPQAETFSPQTSLAEYKNAKYLFQDVRDIISGIPYSSKYWEYINDDDQEAKSNIFLADQNILRMNKIVK
jgi:hypothetical protein